jgi:hypothetical protein
MHPNKIEEKNWLIRFLKEGKFFDDLQIHTKVSDAYSSLGKPTSKIGNDERGWLLEFRNGILIRQLDSFINELAILFNKRNVKYSIEITSFEHAISSSKHITEISKKTLIHEFLKILGYNNIKWKSCDERSKECLSIITEGNVLIIFTLEDGKLFKIVYSDISVALGNAAFSSFINPNT